MKNPIYCPRCKKGPRGHKQYLSTWGDLLVCCYCFWHRNKKK